LRNIGDTPTSGPILLSDPMPAGLTLLLPVNAPGWDCSASTAVLLSCTYNAIVPANSSTLTVTANAQIAANFNGLIINTATAETAGELATANNIGTSVCTRPAPAPAASPLALGVGVALLIGIAGLAMRRRMP
jgi:hypothetical protein